MTRHTTMVRALAVAVLAAVAMAYPAASAQEVTITDPAEYNSYMSAQSIEDPAGRASALEGFLQAYPNSVVRGTVLELLMMAYQQAGNPTKTMETAHRLLEVNPAHIRALALLAYSHREAADAGQDPQQNLTEGTRLAERGLKALQGWTVPQGMSEADAAQFRQQVAAIFHGVAGMAALQQKDFRGAQRHLEESVKANPDNLRDVYPLALSYLQAENANESRGLFYIARAVNLAQGTPAQAQIANFGRARYVSYHGSDEGWNDLVAQARAKKTAPEGFHIEPDSPAKRAARLAAAQPVKEMSLAEWSYILNHGDEELRERVWKEVQALPAVAFRTVVVEATRNQLRLSGTAESIEEGRADVEVAMAAPLPPAQVPKPGTEVDVQGKPASYEREPFVLRLSGGSVIPRR
jgi:tetratricopeptide (TPR) repeat protein